MKIPDLFVPEKDLENKTESLLKEVKPSVQSMYTKFEVISASTYAEGLAKLKEQRQKPFTFAENVEARIADYEVNGENTKLFDIWLDSVTGIVYKANSTKFKIILRSDKLEDIKPDFNQSFIPVDYDAEKGVELDSEKGKYNRLLTREEAKDHEFWLAAMKGDKKKLVEYVDIWFDKTKSEEGMGIYLISNTDEDELRVIALGDDDYSGADGDCSLENNACFISGA